MKRLLILLCFFWLSVGVASAPYKTRYRTVIKTSSGKRYVGKFVAINDSVLTFQRAYKLFPLPDRNRMISFSASDISTIRIYHKLGRPIGQVVGGIGALVFVFQPGLGIVVYVIAPFVACFSSVAFGEIGNAISLKLSLKDLKMTDFSSIEDQLKPYEAKLRSAQK